MGIVGGPDSFIYTWDATNGTQIDRNTMTTGNAGRDLKICLDGRFLWVGNLLANTLKQYDLNNGSQLGSASLTFTPAGMCHDGRYIWEISSGGTVSQIDPQTASVVGTLTFSGSAFRGLTFDGRYAWTSNGGSGNIEQFDLTTGSKIGGFTAPANTRDLWHDGRFLWIFTAATSITGRVRQYDPTTGGAMGNFITRTYSLDENGDAITGDGRFLYTAERLA